MLSQSSLFLVTVLSLPGLFAAAIVQASDEGPAPPADMPRAERAPTRGKGQSANQQPIEGVQLELAEVEVPRGKRTLKSDLELLERAAPRLVTRRRLLVGKLVLPPGTYRLRFERTAEGTAFLVFEAPGQAGPAPPAEEPREGQRPRSRAEQDRGQEEARPDPRADAPPPVRVKLKITPVERKGDLVQGLVSQKSAGKKIQLTFLSGETEASALFRLEAAR